MPKVCSCLVSPHFARGFVFATIASLLVLIALGCNPEKQQDLNPPPPDATPSDATRTLVPTAPPIIVRMDPTSVPTTTSTAGGLSVTPGTATSEPVPAAASASTQATETVQKPTSEPASPSTTQSADGDSTPFDTAPRSFTGILHGGVVAIGSETTGWALHVPGRSGDLDVDVTAISGQVKALDGRLVTITGRIKQKNWVESGKTQLLIADTIAASPLPDMNK